MQTRGSGLTDIRLKLARAEKHLGEIQKALEQYKEGECTLTLEKDEELQMAVQRVRLAPSSSPEISAIAGDFFANVRSALDYIVWQLVLTNSPNQPGPNNQFPIANSPKDFSEQLERKRLRGISEEAVKTIEALQPYQDRKNPLGILNKLVNIDKHRTLNVVSVVADNTEMISQSGGFALFLGDEEVRHGSIFGEIGIPFGLLSTFRGLGDNLPSVTMRGTCSLFLAFDDPSAESLAHLRVDRTLEDIFNFVTHSVLPQFDRFLA